jgi:hypothetical protein
MNVGGYFEPANASFNLLATDTQQDFAWTQWPVAISGTVFYANSNVGVPNAVISFSSEGNAITDAGGNYRYFVPLQWSGIATPSYALHAGMFVPLSRSYNNLNNGVDHQDYHWYPITNYYVIAGSVLEGDSLAAITNATVRFISDNGFVALSNVTVNVNGAYTNVVSDGWSGVVFPELPEPAIFAPMTNTYNNVTNNWLYQNFLKMP